MPRRGEFKDPLETFFENTARASDGPVISGVRCLEWQAGTFSGGYGCISVRRGGTRKSMRAHRFAYEEFVGPVPDGMCVCHRCDNRLCCEVAHLFIGTHADNLEDMTRKGRRSIQRGECHGHARFTESDVVSIRERYAAGLASQYELAKEHNVRQSSIGEIVRGDTWSHVGGPRSVGQSVRRERMRRAGFAVAS